jgi:hypothetical protein
VEREVEREAETEAEAETETEAQAETETEAEAEAETETESARQRLGADVVSYIFHRAAETWGKDLMHMWRSLAVFAIDGTFLRTADSDANHEHFGRHYTGKKKTPSSHPLVRMVVVSNVRSRMFVGAEVGPCTTSELTLAKPLLASLPSNAVVILDRLYTGAPQLLLVAAAEGPALPRAGQEAAALDRR